ncbi:MAG: hypothetical protein H0Z19_08050 [Archaeoglobus sp.]|uniref:hypothetical protein n=1 Tax=Archaeoglobus sp. TaxID=1872626 RepID=UPI001DF3BC1D|nr:hypothetical protein [Archaeoglobus sp.]MBO8180415.1 hypothetical protein [Archaeoglobus sp.]
MIKSYLIKTGEELREHGEVPAEYRELFSILLENKIKNAVLLLNDEALYFESGAVSGLVEVDRKHIGAAKILLRKVAREAKKVDLSSVEEAFKLAEELEKADLNGIAKFLR